MAEIQTLRDSLRAVRAENERLRSGAAARRKAEEALRAQNGALREELAAAKEAMAALSLVVACDESTKC